MQRLRNKGSIRTTGVATFNHRYASIVYHYLCQLSHIFLPVIRAQMATIGPQRTIRPASSVATGATEILRRAIRI